MKFCPKCNKHLDPQLFFKRVAAKDGLQAYCKNCHKINKSIKYKSLTSKQCKRCQKVKDIVSFAETNSQYCFICVKANKPKISYCLTCKIELSSKNRTRICISCYKSIKKNKLISTHKVVEYKKCVLCLITKSPDCFYLDKYNSDKLGRFCKICANKLKKSPKYRNSARILYYKDIQKTREKQRNQYRTRVEKHPEILLRCSISTAIRSKIKKQNGTKGGESIFSYLPYTFSVLIQHLESKFESWMNWNNWGKYCVETWDDNDSCTWKWQIDHIIPQSLFPFSSMKEENFKKCWALENLRPLSAKTNIFKSNKLEGDLF